MKARFFIATIALAAGALMAKNYSGGELFTNETWMYGKFEARMRMAAGSGTVSSMFLYHNDSYLGGEEPWVEVDIEILGKNPNSFQSNIITGYGPVESQNIPNRKIKSEKHHAINPASNESFHTYGIEWTPDYVAWTLDGQVVRKTVKGQENGCKAENGGQQQSYCSQVQDLGKKPQGLRFNLWSHEDAGWVGAWNDNILPVYQFINWVKVYEYKPGQGDNGSDFKLQWTDDFKTFDANRWSKGDWTFDGNRVDISPSNIYAKDGMVIIALTKKGQESFNGQVPQDPEGDAMLNGSSPQSSSSEQFNPPSSSSEQETGILQNRIKVQNREVRGTVNAKGARVSETNRAHYQVDFNY
jgi:beta-glucanase (GH16 family)